MMPDACSRQVVINADDLGICATTNQAIEQAHRKGVLTSASLMANGPAFEDAATRVVRGNPCLGLGVHLCLTSGRPVLPERDVPLLVAKDGRFCKGFLALWRSRGISRRELLVQIEREWDAQIQRAISADLALDHLDSHRHVHMIPDLFSIAVRLATRHGINAIRVSHEPCSPLRIGLGWRRIHRRLPNVGKKLLLSNLARTNRLRLGHVNAPRHTFGVIDSGLMDFDALADALAHAGPGLTEIVTHPGGTKPVISSDLDSGDTRFLKHGSRRIELEALVDHGIRELIERRNARLVTFGEWAERMGLPATNTLNEMAG